MGWPVTAAAVTERSPDRTPGPTGAADPRRWAALAIIAVAQLMVVLDATIVNIALPKAQQALGISDVDRQWVVTAYTLTFGGLLLLGGRIADYWGRKRTFLLGIIGFAARLGAWAAWRHTARRSSPPAPCRAASARCSPRPRWPCSPCSFTDAKERAKAFGVYGAIAGGGAAVGLLLGGVLTEYANWRWCLLVNVPVALIAAAFARAPGQREPGARQHPLRHPRRGRWSRSAWPASSTASPRPPQDGWASRSRSAFIAGRAGAAGRVRGDRSCARPTRCCPCGSCWTGPAAAPTSPPCSPAPG